MARPDRSLAEHVCLAIVCEGPTHGWAVARLLAPEAEIGRIWTLSRPLTYRAIDQLVAEGSIDRRGSEPGQGRDRTILAATPAGRRRSRRWLGQPVAHVRDVRTELLVKLELGRRRGLDLTGLIEAQQKAFEPLLRGLEEGSPTDPPDLVMLWRLENARSVGRFLRTAHAAVEES